MGLNRFDCRIVILPRVLASADATGEQVESWPEDGAYRMWAEKSELSAGQQLAAGVRQSSATVRFVTRDPVEARSSDRLRVVSSGELFRIDGVYRDGRTRVLTCARLD